ncbi:hypothetical protein [uncultured Nostoc sp.]|uniref:hypothetical protein n=1 Tax=uncultured Nostoc sp. TaxID=340711 RepID=UPI0026094D60|nr:hypothetical protein [uncultured Nostoc sp.]
MLDYAKTFLIFDMATCKICACTDSAINNGRKLIPDNSQIIDDQSKVEAAGIHYTAFMR